MISTIKEISFVGFFVLISTMLLSGQALSIGLVSSVDYGFRTLKFDDGRDDYEKGLINFRFGVDLIKNFNSRFAIKTGLRYYKIGYKTNDVDYHWPSEVLDGAYDPDPLLPYSGTIEHIYQYLEVPLDLRYFFIYKKVGVFVEGGISLNYSLDKTWREKYDFNRINVSTNFGFGINAAISEKISIFGMPIFRYHLSKTLMEKTVIEHLYSLGLEFGINLEI